MKGDRRHAVDWHADGGSGGRADAGRERGRHRHGRGHCALRPCDRHGELCRQLCRRVSVLRGGRCGLDLLSLRAQQRGPGLRALRAGQYRHDGGCLAPPPFSMLGPHGMSLRRPISTATASQTFFGRTTAALPVIWTMDGTTSAGSAAGLFDVGPTWHVLRPRLISTATASPTFFGSTTAALPVIWTMDGTASGSAAGPFRCRAHVACLAAAADFNGDGKSDILWQHDSGLPVIWTMDGTTHWQTAALFDLGPTCMSCGRG